MNAKEKSRLSCIEKQDKTAGKKDGAAAKSEEKAASYGEPTRIAVLSIIVENPESTAKLNEALHEYAGYVVGRMGIPYREKNINIISLVLDAPQTKISALSGQIGRLPGVTAKAAYAKV